MKTFLTAIAVFAVISIIGCSLATREFNQTIIGQFLEDDKPVQGIRIKLQLTNEPDQNPIMTTTNDIGSFELHRKAFLGRLAVIVQDDMLSVQQEDQWLTVWRGIYGPAPDRISFICRKTQKSRWKCTMNGMESQERLTRRCS